MSELSISQNGLDNQVEFNQELAQQIVDSDEQFPSDFELAWQWLGYKTKASAKRKLIRNFEEGIDYSTKWLKRFDTSASGFSRYEEINLTIDAFKLHENTICGLRKSYAFGYIVLIGEGAEESNI